MAKLSASDIRNQSVEIAKSAKGLGALIHTHLMNIAKHVAEHRDTSLATHFLVLIQNNKDGEKHSIVRDDAVKNWLEMFGFCKWGKDKAGKPGFTLNAKALDAKEENHFKNAARNPWNKLTPAKAYSTFDFDKAFAQLLKRADEKANETGPNGEVNKVDPVKLTLAKELAASMGIEL